MAATLLNAAALEKWDSVGRNEIAKKCRSIMKPDADLMDPRVSRDVTSLLYGVCRQCIYGGLRPEQVTPLLSEIVGLHKEMTSQLVDVLAVFGMFTV